MRNLERILWIILTIFLTYGSLRKSYDLGYYKQKAEFGRVCNKAFVLYLKHNHGININLDRLYEDAVKWVDDPRYQ